MKRTFKFGKIDYYNTGREINAVEITIELIEKDGKPVFSASGDVWNIKHRDIIMGGQCLDDPIIVKHLKGNKTFEEILDLWKKYHLNDMHAGTYEQETCIKENQEERNLIEKRLKEENKNKYISNYVVSCELLKNHNLYEVEVDGKPYKYGHSWLYWDIPNEDLLRIKNLLVS